MLELIIQVTYFLQIPWLLYCKAHSNTKKFLKNKTNLISTLHFVQSGQWFLDSYGKRGPLCPGIDM